MCVCVCYMLKDLTFTLILLFFCRNTIEARWLNFHDPHSGLSHYDWCIGNSPIDCNILPQKTVHLYNEATATRLDLQHGDTVYVTVTAYNNVGLSANRTSLPVKIDSTPPVFTKQPSFTMEGVSLRSGTQIDPSVIKIEWLTKDDESSVLMEAVGLSLHHDGKRPLDDQEMLVSSSAVYSLHPEDELFDGDEYYAHVTSCNIAGLCNRAEVGPLLVDSTPPIIGELKDALKWKYHNGKNSIDLIWDGFYDPHSGIKEYYIKIGTTYHGDDFTSTVQIQHQKQKSTQSHTVDISKVLPSNTKLYFTLWARNGAGLLSEPEHQSFIAVATNQAGTEGFLDEEKFNCAVHSCNEDCTCAVVGQPCKHILDSTTCLKETDDLTTGNGSRLIIKDGWSDQNTWTTSGRCLHATWNDTFRADVHPIIRYEWSVSLKGTKAGGTLFDLVNDRFWFDVGLQTEGTYCLPRENRRRLRHNMKYIFHVRAWLSRSKYMYFTSPGVTVDKTLPTIRRGAGVMDTENGKSVHDVRFVQSPGIFSYWNTLYGSIFVESTSGLHHVDYMAGTSRGSKLYKVMATSVCFFNSILISFHCG